MNAKIRMKNIIIDIFIYKNNRNDSSLYCKLLIYYDNKTYLYRNRKIKSVRLEDDELTIVFMDRKIHKTIRFNTTNNLMN